ncbi:hypothetical protein GE061_015078 [Apolygus lucorum]|uniref:Uncharacterized protein n=1 Tax=Apolygus lucorum TaxID=248454 RepID=A0A8S9XM20_APOLU|nr:hypothetical protein GE061_015078 [Apolygus lucorum]
MEVEESDKDIPESKMNILQIAALWQETGDFLVIWEIRHQHKENYKTRIARKLDLVVFILVLRRPFRILLHRATDLNIRLRRSPRIDELTSAHELQVDN